jgi:hypothetical protein
MAAREADAERKMDDPHYKLRSSSYYVNEDEDGTAVPPQVTPNNNRLFHTEQAQKAKERANAIRALNELAAIKNKIAKEIREERLRSLEEKQNARKNRVQKNNGGTRKNKKHTKKHKKGRGKKTRRHRSKRYKR